MTLEEIIVALTPFVIWLAGYIVSWLKPLIPGWAMLLTSTALNAAYVFFANLLVNPNIKWYYQLAYGTMAVLFAQVKKQFSEEKVASDTKKLKEAKKLL